MNATSHEFYHPIQAQNPWSASTHGSMVQQGLGLEHFLVPNPSSTVLFRARDDRMQTAGIFKGDLLVVDRSLKPHSGQVVVAVKDTELSLGVYVADVDLKKRVLCNGETSKPPIEFLAFDVLEEVWGVVTYGLHKFKI